MPFELLKSETLVDGRAFKVRRDQVKTSNGTVTLDIIEHGGSIALIPIDESGNILFVRQYRHATGQELLELPAGTREANETFETCAAREVREETGMEAGKLQRLGEFYLAPGYSTELMGVFLATELKPKPLQADDDEFLEVERYSMSEVFEMIADGQFQDAKTLAAVLLARPYLEKYLG